MYTQHKTKSGQNMQVCEMDNEHLLNTIKLILNRVSQIKELMRGNLQENDPFKNRLKQFKHLSMEDLEDNLTIAVNGLYPYVTEASLRGLEVTNLLQAVFERKEQDKPMNQIIMISNKSVSDFDNDISIF